MPAIVPPSAAVLMYRAWDHSHGVAFPRQSDTTTACVHAQVRPDGYTNAYRAVTDTGESAATVGRGNDDLLNYME